MNGNLPAK